MKKEPTKLPPINKWLTDDKPREKLLSKGCNTLTDAELLAILIGSGNHEENAIQLSQRILHSVENNLNSLARLSVSELISSFKGIGEAKAISITAALELGKRRDSHPYEKQPVIKTSKDVYDLFSPMVLDLPYEELWMAVTNRAGKVIEKLKVSQGGIDGAQADIRLILKHAILKLASGIVLCHNHPSGNLIPSPEDTQLTHRIYKSARLMDITLIDHVIIAEKGYYSFADQRRLSQ